MNSKVQDYSRLARDKVKVKHSTLADLENSFDDFYKSLISDNLVTVLKPTLDEYNSTLLKAIACKEPFFKEKKDEFKDALIWSSIITKIPNIKDGKNYLLTNNYQDFWNQTRDSLHSTLELESNGKIEICASYKDLFDRESELQDMRVSEEFKKWYEMQIISIPILTQAMDKYLWNHFRGSLENLISKIQITEFYPEIEMGYILPEIRKENIVVTEIKSQDLKGSFADIEIGVTLGYQAVAHLPNLKKGDFSTTEHLWIESEVLLNCAYDKDMLFRPIEVEIVKSKIL